MQFIPLAEETGLILPVGNWVLREACTLLKAVSDCGKNGFTISVNVSPLQFRQGNFVEQVAHIIEDTKVDPHCLELEITESMLVTDMEDAIQKMQSLQALGVSFAIDDFGTGYSSLAYLTRLPLNKLKIDQSFVRHVLTEANDAAIVETILSMAQHLDLNTVAEGVETKGQLDFLTGHDCKVFQGYYFSKPLTQEAVMDVIHTPVRKVI